MKLTFLITIALFFTTALYCQTTAQPPSNYSDQNAGTEVNPFLISNLANLRWLSEHPSDWWVDMNTLVYFKQTADIDASETITWNDGRGFIPIGNPVNVSGYHRVFIGIYDGNNHSISSVYINVLNSLYYNEVGFFNFIRNSTIKNLHLENIDYTSRGGWGWVGGIVAYASYYNEIYNCSISGSINATGFMTRPVIGGMVGEAVQSSVRSCFSYANINIDLTREDSTLIVGGIVGRITGGNPFRTYCYIENNVSIGNISTNRGRPMIGGIVGDGFMGIIIDNSHSRGNIDVYGYTFARVGGVVGMLVGYHEGYVKITNSSSSGDIFVDIENAHAYAGGIVGETYADSSIENCYSLGNISCSASGLSYAGGIAGAVGAHNIPILYSFSKGNITAGRYAGGIIANGLPVIKDSFATGIISSYRCGGISSGGGNPIERVYFAGSIIDAVHKGGISVGGSPTIIDSFWNYDTTGLTDAVGDHYPPPTLINTFYLSTEEMKMKDTYVSYNWDFDNIWDIDSEINEGYPFLKRIPFPAIILPVTNLKVEIDNKNVILSWDPPLGATAVYIGYEIYRDSILLTPNSININQFTDYDVLDGTYIYSVVIVYQEGKSKDIEIKVVVDNSVFENKTLVNIFKNELKNNYPNPFNPETTISFSLEFDSFVNIEIYNIRGQKIRTLIQDHKTSGEHQIVWNGQDDNNIVVGSGVYFYKFTSGAHSQTKRMILMK